MYQRNKLAYIEESDLYFSILDGRQVYCWNEEYKSDSQKSGGEINPRIFRQVETQEGFQVQRVKSYSKYSDRYRKAVQRHKEFSHLVWPVDMIFLNQEPVLDQFVERYYGVRDSESRQAGEENIALVFPVSDHGIVRSAQDVLNETKAFDWKSPAIQRLAVKILEAYRDLNKLGYLNFDVDFRSFHLTETGEVLFGYSPLIVDNIGYMGKDFAVAENDDIGDSPSTVIFDNKLWKDEFPIEFAEPALVKAILDSESGGAMADERSQNYSLAAMLFYLMIGRYPYDGPLLAGVVDTNHLEHIHKFEVYHRNPVFIFDAKNSENHLGTFAADQRIIDLWEELPAPLKRLFERNLRGDNATRKTNRNNTTPQRWLEVLHDLGWC